jgi:hypothetical protein
MKTKIKLALASLLLAVLGAVAYSNSIQSHNKVYQLLITVPVVTPFQVGLAVHERLLVTHVERQSDGALCFDLVQEEKPGCIKVENYYLIETRME